MADSPSSAVSPVPQGRTLSESEFTAIRDSLLQAAPAGLSEAEFHRWIGPRLAAAVGTAEQLPPAPEGTAFHRFVSGLGTLVSGLGSGLEEAAQAFSPMQRLAHAQQALEDVGHGQYRAALGEAVATMAPAAAGMAPPVAQQIAQAAQAAHEGRYVQAGGHAAAAALPIFGPPAAEAGEQIARGDVAGGFGRGIADIAGVVAPEILGRSVGAVGSALRGGNAARSAAQAELADLSDFAQRHGIKQSVADVSTNPVALKLQETADSSLLGGRVANKAHGQTVADLERTGQGLATQANPVPVSPDVAGETLRNGVARRVEQLDQQANVAYQRADRLAAANKQTIQTGVKTSTSPVLDAQGRAITTQTPITQTFDTPVDLEGVQKLVKPLYDEWTRQGQVAPLMGAKARAYTALDRIMHAPRFVSLGTADQAASDLGAMAGHPEMPELRTAGEGGAARAFGALRGQIDRAAANVPGLQKDLQAGRAATKAKWEASDVLDEVKKEPVQAFNKATARGDTNIAYLKRVAQLSPDAVPDLARAKVDQIIAKLNLPGITPLDRAQGALRDWQALGSETKKLLFPDPGYRQELDRFFKYNAHVARTSNPSGTALTRFAQLEVDAYPAGAAAAYATGNPLLAAVPAIHSGFWGAVGTLMHSPAGVRLLTRGLMLPAHSAQAATWAAQVGNALRAMSPMGTTVPVAASATPNNSPQ